MLSKLISLSFLLTISSSFQGRLLADEAQPISVGAETSAKTSSDLVSEFMTSVNFIRGGSALSEAENLNLKALYHKSISEEAASGAVAKILVVAWSDREAVDSDDKASEGQTVLAQKRAEAVKQVIIDLSNKSVVSYNMARDAGWIAKTFNTRDAKLKDSLKFPGAASEKAAILGNILKTNGGLGKVVVIVQRESTIPKGTKASGR